MKNAITVLSTCLIFLIVNFSCSSCKKNTDPAPDNPWGLPNATQTGQDFIACRINGKNFISYYDLYGTKAGFYNDTFGMNGTNKGANLIQSLNFTIYKNQKENIVYDFKQNFAKSLYITDSTCFGYSSSIIKSNAVSGYIKLTKYDKTLKVISGVFECKYPIDNCDTLNITDGRFDFNYY